MQEGYPQPPSGQDPYQPPTQPPFGQDPFQPPTQPPVGQQPYRQDSGNTSVKPKDKSLSRAIISLVAAIIFAGIGIYAYNTDQPLYLFGIIPLNPIAFGIIAAVLFIWAVYDLVRSIRARKG